MYVFLLVSSCLCGVGAGLIWVAQGKYVAECATDSNKGLFNSVFWVFFSISQVVGNLMGVFVITNVDGSTFYIILTALCLFSSLYFTCLPRITTKTCEQYSTALNIQETLKLLRSERMVKLIPVIVYCGLTNSVLAAIMVPMMSVTMA